MPLINLKNINKIYYSLTKETCALSDIDLEINENEIVGIIGPSGCGKSTILNIITGLDKDYEGTLIKDKNTKIGYMMQNEACLPWLNNFDNALLGLNLKDMITKENILYTRSLFKKYGLFDFINDYPNNLSGGMKQRLSLIRTLAIKPNLLLLDEPFSKLDLENKLKISNDVYKIIKENKIACLLISHDIKEVINLCDKIVIMSKRPGRIITVIDNDLKDIEPIYRSEYSVYNNFYNYIWRIINDES